MHPFSSADGSFSSWKQQEDGSHTNIHLVPRCWMRLCHVSGSYWVLNVDTRIWFQVCPCGICGGCSSTGTCFTMYCGFILSIIMTPELHTHSSIILGWYSRHISNHCTTGISYSILRTQWKKDQHVCVQVRVCVCVCTGTCGREAGEAVNPYEPIWPQSMGLYHSDKLTCSY